MSERETMTNPPCPECGHVWLVLVTRNGVPMSEVTQFEDMALGCPSCEASYSLNATAMYGTYKIRLGVPT